MAPPHTPLARRRGDCCQRFASHPTSTGLATVTPRRWLSPTPSPTPAGAQGPQADGSFSAVYPLQHALVRQQVDSQCGVHASGSAKQSAASSPVPAPVPTPTATPAPQAGANAPPAGIGAQGMAGAGMGNMMTGVSAHPTRCMHACYLHACWSAAEAGFGATWLQVSSTL